MPNYCTNCGKPLKPEWKACTECGTILQPIAQSYFPPPPRASTKTIYYDSTEIFANWIIGLVVLILVLGIIGIMFFGPLAFIVVVIAIMFIFGGSLLKKSPETSEVKSPKTKKIEMKIPEKRYAVLFIMSSSIFIVLFLIAASSLWALGNGGYYSNFILINYLIFGGWEGFIIIMYSAVKINKDFRNVDSILKLYIIGLSLIAFNLVFFLSAYYIEGYFLVLISLIGFSFNLFFLKRLKSLCGKEIKEIDTLLQNFEDWEKSEEGKKED